MSSLFYRLCIVGHKLYFLVNPFHHHCGHQGKCSCLIWLNAIFLRFYSFHIFYALKIILQDMLTLFSYYYFLNISKIKPLSLYSSVVSKVCLIWQKRYDWFHIFIFLCYTTSRTHNCFLHCFLRLDFLTLHVQVVDTIVEYITVSKNVTILPIQHLWWVHIFTKYALTQLFYIVYFLNFPFKFSILEPKSYIQENVRNSHHRPVLVLVLWIVVKEILRSPNPLV